MSRIILRDEGNLLKETKINELEFGLEPQFKKIGKYADEDYAEKKHAKNPLAGFGNIDLINTGAWSNSLFVVRYTDYYIFDSGDPKHGELIQKYGMDIMGLSQKTFDIIQREVYAKQLAQFIKTKIGQ